MALIISIILNAIFFTLAWFFGQEMRKKFRFDYQEMVATGNGVFYHHPGAERAGIEPDMRNITLRSDAPFTARVAFRFDIPVIGGEDMVDVYGFVHSRPAGDGTHVAVVSTYLGNGAAEFIFLVNGVAGTYTVGGEAKPVLLPGKISEVTATSTEADQNLKPDAVYPPHWFQRFGIFS